MKDTAYTHEVLTPQEGQAFHQRLRAGFFKVAGWLIPLISSTPALFIWGGLMTMPLIAYIGIMFASLFNPAIRFHGQNPSFPYVLPALEVLLFGGPHIHDKVISIAGVLIMVYSTVHLGLNRRKGLVTSGPYRFARHPQYFGLMVFSVNLTSRCYRETLGDAGWLGPGGTLLVWFATMVAYVLLALVEELHLRTEFGQPYVDYSHRTAFLIPFLRTRRRWLDVIFALVIPMLLLAALVLSSRMLYP